MHLFLRLDRACWSCHYLPANHSLILWARLGLCRLRRFFASGIRSQHLTWYFHPCTFQCIFPSILNLSLKLCIFHSRSLFHFCTVLKTALEDCICSEVLAYQSPFLVFATLARLFYRWKPFCLLCMLPWLTIVSHILIWACHDQTELPAISFQDLFKQLTLPLTWFTLISWILVLSLRSLSVVWRTPWYLSSECRFQIPSHLVAI